MASAVAKAEAPQVPDLVRTPATEITADDVVLPRIYLAQFMSSAVKEQLVKPGCIFAASGSDDPAPQVLWSPGDEQGVEFYVLHLRKGKSWSAPGQELQLFDFDDPDAPADAWVTYNYMVSVPSVDDLVPFKLLLTRTGKSAALSINTILMKNSLTGPSWSTKFVLTAGPRENKQGKFFVPRITVGEAKEDEVKIAEAMAQSLSTNAVEASATGVAPAI